MEAQFSCQMGWEKGLGLLCCGLHQTRREIRPERGFDGDFLFLKERNEAGDVHSSATAELQKPERPYRQWAQIGIHDIEVYPRIIIVQEMCNSVASRLCGVFAHRVFRDVFIEKLPIHQSSLFHVLL